MENEVHKNDAFGGKFENGKCIFPSFKEWFDHITATGDQRMVIGQSLEPFYEKEKNDFLEKCRKDNNLNDE